MVVACYQENQFGDKLIWHIPAVAVTVYFGGNLGDTDGPSQGKVMHSRLVTTRENGTANVEFDLKTFVPRPVAGSLMITTIMWESSTETFLTKKIATRWAK